MRVFRFQMLLMLLVMLLSAGQSRASTHLQTTSVPPGIIGSTFTTSDEGWQVVGDAQDGATTPNWHSAGGNLDGYISAEDDAVGGTWYWEAPAHLLGNRLVAYDTDLTFNLRQSDTDSQFDAADVILIGNDITLEFDTAQNPETTWTAYRIPLHETAGWMVQGTGIAPTASEMQLVLGNLSALWIRGEFRNGPDTGGLDTVQLHGFHATTVIFLPFVSR